MIKYDFISNENVRPDIRIVKHILHLLMLNLNIKTCITAETGTSK
jgi:hypothetical protein